MVGDHSDHSPPAEVQDSHDKQHLEGADSDLCNRQAAEQGQENGPFQPWEVVLFDGHHIHGYEHHQEWEVRSHDTHEEREAYGTRGQGQDNRNGHPEERVEDNHL